jgi:ATP-dependent 26S proteasome regulatory subunit
MQKEPDYLQIKKDLAKKLGRPALETIELNSQEAKLVVCVVGSYEIHEKFSDIGGMDDQLDTIMENIGKTYCLHKTHHFNYMHICSVPYPDD